jgi:hypothetical protein
MDQATDFTALAAHRRREARLQPDPALRQKLVEKGAHMMLVRAIA